MYRQALWEPYKRVANNVSKCYGISYAVLCASCGRLLTFGFIGELEGQTRIDCSLDPTWHRNAVGVYRRSERKPRRKFRYTLPDGGEMYANLQVIIENSERTPNAIPFLMECDGKLLFDERHVPCKERNVVDPFTAFNIALSEVLQIV